MFERLGPYKPPSGAIIYPNDKNIWIEEDGKFMMIYGERFALHDSPPISDEMIAYIPKHMEKHHG